MMRRISAATLALALLGGLPGCASTPVAEAAAVAAEGPCASGDDPLLLWPGELELQAGAALVGAVWRMRGPFGMEPLAPGCVAAWQLEPATAATLDPRTGRGRIAGDAADGYAFAVVAVLGDGRRVPGQVRVVDPAVHPLAGRWRQVGAAGCGLRDEMHAPADPLRELKFTGAGRFQVTWTPFESYVDYWGSYRYQAESGQLYLTVEGGNQRPEQASIGLSAAVKADGTLTVSNIPRGGDAVAAGPSICVMKFARAD